MNADRLKYLLERYRNGECDDAEMAEINEWYHSLNYDPAGFSRWLEEESGDKELAGKLYTNFRGKATPARERRRIWQAAAIVLILAGSTLLFRKYFLPSNHQNDTTQTAVITPGKNKAVLTLADGSQITLDDASSGKLASQQGLNVIKAANGQLIYDFSMNGAGDQQPAAFNTLYTPKGGQYQVTLPDGTKVWLNSDSKLNFPVAFRGKERKVTLTGEAYFEVSHMKNNPFIVTTANQSIEVLGTHFNVNSYADEQTISTTLLEGSVRVSNLFTKNAQTLKPGQQSNLSRHTGDIAVKNVHAEEVIAWKNGYFLFDNQDLPAILRTVSRWYDVEIEFQYTGKYERFGGTFSRSSGLRDILNNLEELGNVHFSIDQRKIIVTK
ncbi:FecR family protein [Chitinophaga cymbidii]|uniref:Iron dicitrate transporter FecR n=1 Tax=Chitinophaga cymbidii TaxID=1096750 RepID=A0A512RG81_9BACT|nr:FecR family protein [Chitinophaga cymbidii]GEP94658.1 iron dicitrate transporter FecR [Chitinophaga cymbidii]